MPFHPREWIVWECAECWSVVNVSPSPVMSGPTHTPRCPYCQHLPRKEPDRRAAIDVRGLGLIGSTETAGLDYLASIANSLVDIRNMLSADRQVAMPVEVSTQMDLRLESK